MAVLTAQQENVQASSKFTSSHSIVITVAVELIGVSILAILASLNDKLGKVIVVIMVGFAFAWALYHTSELQNVSTLAAQPGPTQNKTHPTGVQ